MNIVVCADRLKIALKALEDKGIMWEERSRFFQILDFLHGSGRFSIIAEVRDGADILLLTRLFDRFSGEQDLQLKAYQHLMKMNGDAHGVAIGENDDGIFGAWVMFPCDGNIEILRKSLVYHLNILTTFLETYYDDMFGYLGDLGVLPNL